MTGDGGAGVAPGRWAWAEIDVTAITHNVRTIAAAVAPSEVWAVVKADGYGHGAVAASRAALAGGAAGLAVSLVQEGIELRAAGIEGPVLVLSEQPAAQVPQALAASLTLTVYSEAAIDAIVGAAADGAVAGPVDVHVKVDTGMQRVGASVDVAGALVDRVLATPSLRLAGVFTHLAVADEPERDFTTLQLQRFDTLLESLPIPSSTSIHAANSAGALAHPAARRSFVRAGIAVYGISPGPGVDHLVTDLRPALALKARVSLVKPVTAGTGISYGLRHEFAGDTIVATVPLGYADGVPRRLSSVGGEVLVGGRRRRIVGVVTMDQLMVDCGPDSSVAVGDEVVLIGAQDGPEGLQHITAEEWADRLGTIGYEVVCGISRRVPRVEGRSIQL